MGRLVKAVLCSFIMLMLVSTSDATEKDIFISEYFTHPIELAGLPKSPFHNVEVEIEYENITTGKGALRLSPNLCQLNAFGDITKCEKMMPGYYPFSFNKVELDDPKSFQRVLLELKIERFTIPKPLYLIVHPKSEGQARLVYDYKNPDGIVIYLKSISN